MPNEISLRPTSEERRRFTNVAVAGITFQAGSAAVDSSTIMAALVHQLTGSSLAVGSVTTILRVDLRLASDNQFKDYLLSCQ